MRSILDKKKAQEMSISTIVILALAIIVLVVVVLGFSKGWNYIFDKIGVLPSGLEAAAQSCQVSASSELKTSYCNEFKEVRIGGKKQYMNCENLTAYAEFEPLKEKCDSTTVLSLSKQLCDNKNLKNGTFVSGIDCKDLRLMKP